MAPSVPHQGPLHPKPSVERAAGAATSGWRRGVLVAGAALALISLVAWGVTLALAAQGGSAPSWIGVLALYGLPLAFLLMGVALVTAVIDRRRR